MNAVEPSLSGKLYNGVKPCVCVLEDKRRKDLANVPPKFQNATIANLKVDTTRHPEQAEIVPIIKQNPHGSYFLAGRCGTGKTHLLYALYNEAVMNDRRTVICTMTELVSDYKRQIQASTNNQEIFYPRLSAADLRQNYTKFSIFLDDVDKARPTEYVAELVYDLADAIYSYNHQLVLTTNLSVQELAQHFERADERYGGPIVRRFVDNAKIIEMF